MPRSPRTCSTGKHLSDTLIFVDVDGVLNIGIFDPTGRPLELSTHNVETALKHWGVREGHSQRDCIERIVEVYSHEVGHGEASTYEEFLADPKSGVSAVLVGRLARIITTAQEGSNNVEVVLSSSWRKPQHAVRVGALEGVLSSVLVTLFISTPGRSYVMIVCLE